MIFKADILPTLAKKISHTDTAASSHWNHFHKFFSIDETLEIKNAIGFGDGRKPYSSITKILHYLLQRRYRKMVPNNSFFQKTYKNAKANSLRNSSRFSLDTLRQVLTLTYLKANGLIKDNNISLVIGDGFASMGSILLQSGVAGKVIMINLTKTLFVDVYYAMTLPELEKNNSMVLVDNENDLKIAVYDDNVKMIFVEAVNCNILNASEANLVFNIVSMQEMDMKYIRIYFDQMREIAKKKPVHFYCCNRESKMLPDKTLIEFSSYPWKDQDKHYFDELCPWHQDYYRLIPKFYVSYDGPIIHRFTKLST